MKIRNLLAATVALLLLASFAAQAENTKFYAKPGSKMRIEGTANMIHKVWWVESPLIGGSLEVGPNFPTEPGQTCTPGKVEAKAAPFIMVSSLKSVEEDGKPYSDKMDDIMYEKLKADQFKKIEYFLSELTLKEAPKAKDAPYLFESKGNLVVAGVTNEIAMPVKVLPMGEKKLKISGEVAIKMSSFKIEPPAPKLALGMLKTGDDVKLTFDWLVQGRAPAK